MLITDRFDNTVSDERHGSQASAMPLLLSIVVPTRNRLSYAARLSRSTESWSGEDFEVIVADCSDTPDPSVVQQIMSTKRTRYQHRSPCSMTENWNAALAEARGEFVLIMGDDDGVLQVVLDVARWAFARHVAVVTFSSHKVIYHWPDFPSPNAGKLYVGPVSSTARGIGRAERHYCLHADLRNMRSQRVIATFSAYRGLVSRRTLCGIRNRGGEFVKSTCPDFYLAFSLALSDGAAVHLDFPVVVDGKSGQSNSGRFARKEYSLQPHLKEFGSNPWPSEFPGLDAGKVNLYLFTAEAAFRALRDHRPSLLPKFNLAHVFAIFLLTRQPWRYALAALRQIVRSEPPVRIWQLPRCLFSELLSRLKYTRISRALRPRANPGSLHPCDSMDDALDILQTQYAKLIECGIQAMHAVIVDNGSNKLTQE